MACFVNEISVIIFILLGVVSVVMCQWEIDRDDNIEPFSLLCRIYNVAKNPPINHVDLEEPHKIVEEINSINASFSEEKVANETEQMGNIVVAQHSTTTREAALGQLSLMQITQRANKILEDIRKMKVTEETEKAKAEFNNVIFGEDGNESQLDKSALSGVKGRATSCGSSGLKSKGNSAGKNLVVDFFCLCVRRTDDSGVNQVCGFYVGIKNGQLGWNESEPMGSSTMWASIKGGCGKFVHQHPKSTTEVRHILDQFLKHLKMGGVYRWGDNSNIKGSERKEGMLGTGVGTKENDGNGPVCDGKKGDKSGTTPGGVCVYYGPESDWETNVYWIKQFRAAVANVDAVNNQTATIQRATQKLQMLLHRAEEIYETAKVITEIQKTVGLTTLQNATGNLTVYSATRIRSYSYNPNSYLIPLWVLLLL